MTDHTVNDAGPGTAALWSALAVRAGGPQRLDAALRQAIGPVLGRTPGVEAWYFSRWVDQRGPHLRVELRADEASVVEVADGVRVALRELPETRSPEPLLPPTAFQRGGEGPVAVEVVQHRSERQRFGDGLPLAERFFQMSSETALEALPSLERGRQRIAFGLALMENLGELGLERDERSELWRDVARQWTGEGKHGRNLLARLNERAERLRPDLLAAAEELRASEGVGSALERYGQESERMLVAARRQGLALRDVVRHHAHLTGNRLGVAPLEEALLAGVLAEGVRRPPLARRQPADKPEGTREALRLHRVSKDGEQASVLDEVSLVVEEGEVFGVLGPEGAGKSSLLGIAAGLRVATTGKVRLLGTELPADPDRLAGEVGVPLPEEELAADASVRENLELRARSIGGAAVDATLELTGLADRSAAAVHELELGELRRLLVGTALVGEPRILFLDEATRELSPTEREALWRIVRERPTATTVVLATSSLQDARALCNRVALVVAGSVVEVAEPERIAEDHFSWRTVRFHTTQEFDPATLRELPEVRDVRVERRDDHHRVEVVSRQPDELLRLVGSDPHFPAIQAVSEEDLQGTFARAETLEPHTTGRRP